MARLFMGCCLGTCYPDQTEKYYAHFQNENDGDSLDERDDDDSLFDEPAGPRQATVGGAGGSIRLGRLRLEDSADHLQQEQQQPPEQEIEHSEAGEVSRRSRTLSRGTESVRRFFRRSFRTSRQRSRGEKNRDEEEANLAGGDDSAPLLQEPERPVDVVPFHELDLLSALPSELLLDIFKALDSRSLRTMAMVSRRFRAVEAHYEEELWRGVCHRRGWHYCSLVWSDPLIGDKEPSQEAKIAMHTWKELYRRQHMLDMRRNAPGYVPFDVALESTNTAGLYKRSRNMILKGHFSCSEGQIVKFAALQQHIELDGRSEEEHPSAADDSPEISSPDDSPPEYMPDLGDSFESVDFRRQARRDASSKVSWRIRRLLPPFAEYIENVEQQIQEARLSFANLGQLEGMYLYVVMCRALFPNGITYFRVREPDNQKKKMMPRLLGLTRDSMVRLDVRTAVNKQVQPNEVLSRWPYSLLRLWRNSPVTFEAIVRSAGPFAADMLSATGCGNVVLPASPRHGHVAAPLTPGAAEEATDEGSMGADGSAAAAGLSGNEVAEDELGAVDPASANTSAGAAGAGEGSDAPSEAAGAAAAPLRTPERSTGREASFKYSVSCNHADSVTELLNHYVMLKNEHWF